MSWWDEAVGRTAWTERSFTPKDISTYAELTEDSPTAGHVPEPLVTGLFSKLLGVDLPGPGTNYLKQDAQFVSAARVGEMLHAAVEITRVRPDKHLVDLATTCSGEDGRLICRGRALVLARGLGVAAGPQRT